MSDSRKTKGELIAELTDLRKRLAALDTHRKHVGDKKKAPPKAKIPREPRRPLKADIEFISAFDLIEAKGINISEGGISIKTSDKLPFEMRYTLDGKTVSRTAHLIWLKHTGNGGYHFGFKFVNGDAFPYF